MALEILDRLVTFGTPLYLMAKQLLGTLVTNPEIQQAAAKKLVEVAKGGRTRGDELLFFSSLIGLEGVTIENKLLFLEKHNSLINPDLEGKTDLEKKDLAQKQRLAKGLVFLIAEDNTCSTDKSADRFRFANKVWHGIFLGIDRCRNNLERQDLLEKRILQFGKNNQDGMTLEEVWKQISSKGGNFFDSLREKMSTNSEDLGKTMKSLKDRAKAWRDAAPERR